MQHSYRRTMKATQRKEEQEASFDLNNETQNSYMPQDTLTVVQKKYLLALYRLQITGVSQVEIANELGVTKSSAHKIIHALMELGLIRRRNRCEIYLSKEGTDLAEKLDDQYTTVTEYLLSNLELEGETARREALMIALQMSPAFIEAFLNKIEGERIQYPSSREKNCSLSSLLKDGVYQLPFQLLRLYEDRVSMGDKGFAHPCYLKLQDGVGCLELNLCEMSCKSIAGRVLDGKLDHLWFYENGTYKEAKITDQVCYIPVNEMALGFDSHGNLRSGVMTVRVKSSVGIFAMPEAQARLKFNFRSCKLVETNLEKQA